MHFQLPLLSTFRIIMIVVGLGFSLSTTSCVRTICDDTCAWPKDGECDDGGEGSIFSNCDLGTDCTDCGEREEE